MPTRIAPTISTLQGDLDPKKGVQSIDRWLGDLETADWRGAKTIHSNLASLKRELESDSPDGTKIAELLGTLGDETTRAASQADGNTADQLRQLGDALTQAGQSLNG